MNKGSGLIVVILVMAFLVTVGIAVITVTGVGSLMDSRRGFIPG
jgi:hypothetical protein